ncbi:MAG: ACP S-malonyltransferase, partial [Gammaproteobacteria bacterium]|nr:ACP S-malonyltransferase [Gammaproteobacteria bacterium]
NEFDQIKHTYAEASQVLGYDLWKLVQEGPEEVLAQTVHTQPALLAGSYAIWRILQTKKNIQPSLLAGHSLGEYTALVCAEAFSFQDAIRLVAARGQYMQEAVPIGQGALAAIIGLDDAMISDLCSKAKQDKEVLSPANFNCPGQVVIGGHVAAVERAIQLAKESGARMAKLLPVSVPSHCALMKPAAEQLKKMLETISIQNPRLPVINNINVAPYDNAASIREGLVKQLFMPVRWVETIQYFAHQGISHIVECGPGKVLSGLNKRISTEMKLDATTDLVNLSALLETSFQTE